MASFTSRNIPALREELQHAKASVERDERLAGGISDHGVARLTKIIDLLEAGAETVGEVHNGLLVDGAIIAAVRKDRCRIVGKPTWFDYHTPKLLVDYARDLANGGGRS